MLEKFLHFSLNVETEKKYKEKVSTTVLTAIFIENSYGYKYSLRICLKLFSNPIYKKKTATINRVSRRIFRKAVMNLKR